MTGAPKPGLRVPRWALLGVMAAMIGAIVAIWSSGARRTAEQAARYMPAEELRTTVPSAALRACLDDRGADALALQERWGSPKGLPETQRKRNTERSIQVDVVDRGDHRLVRVSTQNARPLAAAERAVLDTCLAG